MNSRYSAIVYYPPYLGGNWLSSTIQGLETGNVLPSAKKSIFDHDKKSQKILCTHLLDFEKWNSDPAGIADMDHYLFSSPCSYFHFCQRAHKGYLNNSHRAYIKSGKIGEQALALVDVGSYLLRDADFSRYYDHIDLNYDWIFYDQDKFVDQLTEILHHYDIKIDHGYIFRSIEVYKANSLNPRAIIGDNSNFIWLSWCLIWLEQQGIELDFQIRDVTDIKQLASDLERYQNFCVEYTLELCKQHQ